MEHPAQQGPPAAARPAPRLTGIPLTLWTHVAWELLRVFVVTTGIMVTVIAFGAAAKPLAENALGAETVLKYVSLAMVPMLQFAIPFAAGFAATLVMHRFVTDNEILAMSACGMSHRRILAPVAVLGVLLGAAMLVLVSLVVPRFWVRMKELATADATRMLVAAVERGEALTADRLMIYADSAREVEPPAGSGASRRLLLSGVAAVEMSGPWSGKVTTEFTAEDAAVDIHELPGGAVAKMTLMNATVVRPGEGAIVSVPLAEPEAASIYRGFERSPKFLTVPEIMELRADVDSAQSVQELKRPMAASLAAVDLWKCVEPAAGSGSVELGQPGSPRSVRIEGVRIAAGRLSPAEGRGEFALVETVDGRPVRRARASAGELRAVSEPGFPASFSLSVPAATVPGDEDGVRSRWPARLDDLLPPGCRPGDWESADGADVLAAAEAVPAANGAGPYASLRAAALRNANALDLARRDVVWESDSHLANRAAQSVSVLLVLLLGGALAVAMRQALPLTVYVLAFLPAVANIFMLSGGQLMMSDGRMLVGSLVMWGGNAVLLAVLVAAWRRLSRN